MLRTMSLTSSRFRSLGVAVGLLGLLLSVPACVPYVKYEDSIAKLNRANQVNGDLERAMRDAQLGETHLVGQPIGPAGDAEGFESGTVERILEGLQGAVRGWGGSGAGEGNRTLVLSLGSSCSTIELHPPMLMN